MYDWGWVGTVMTKEEKLQRRLAAILIADVAGYSRLMQGNEETIHHRWQGHLLHAAEIVALHSGRIVKTTGDGFVAEFGSVVEGARAATTWLNETASREAAIGEPDRIQLRMGLHLGDIIVEANGDVYGDGVNIAARLEQCAPVGGICIDDATRRHLVGKINLPLRALGPRQLKNIAEPMSLWVLDADAKHVRKPGRSRRLVLLAAVSGTVVAVAAIAALSGGYVGLPGIAGSDPRASIASARPASKLSIVVLPFVNASANPGDDIFADALTEDLVTDLSRIADAFVISASTSFTLKGKMENVPGVAQSLGVSYALTGTVRRAGEEIQVTSTLVDAATGGVLWSERYERTRSDIHSLQQQLTGQIARTLNLRLREAASQKAARGAPADLDAQDYATRAWAELWTKPQSKRSNDAALDFAAKALALDPNNADALASKSYALTRGARYAWLPGSTQYLAEQAVEAGERAVALDDRDADAYFALAFATAAVGDIERGLDLYRKAIELNPNHAPSYSNYGFTQALNGNPGEARAWIERALAISPRDPLVPIWRSTLALAASLEGKYELALAEAKAAIAANPNHPPPYLYAAVALKRLGQLDEAENMMQRHRRIRPDWTITKQKDSQKGSPAYDRLAAPILADLQALGLPET